MRPLEYLLNDSCSPNHMVSLTLKPHLQKKRRLQVFGPFVSPCPLMSATIRRGRRKVFDAESVRQFRMSLCWVLSDNVRVGQLPSSPTLIIYLWFKEPCSQNMQHYIAACIAIVSQMRSEKADVRSGEPPPPIRTCSHWADLPSPP